MKFISIVFCFLFIAGSLLGQELTSKKGEKILPEKGNWSLMFDAVPFFKYAGNAFNGSIHSTVSPSFPKGFQNTLVLKKMKSETRALRIKARAGFLSNSVDSIVIFLGGINPEPSVTDKRKVTKQNIAVGLGMQNSKGKGRFQGYFGGEILIGYSSGDTTYTYGGGSLTQFNWLHTNTFGQGRGVTSVKQGSTFSINPHLVFGVEFFFAPKMSLSAEYSWGLGYRKTNDGTKTREQWDFAGGSGGKLKTITEKIRGSSSFSLDTDNNAGSINLAFYF